jgi:hypothetical protein
MSWVRPFPAAFAAACCLALPASAAIFRCTAAGGAVSYQEIACPATDSERVVDVPAQYPSADPTERARLFEREAALDRRLEAQRERDSREAVAHAMQPPAQPIPAAAPEDAPLVWGIPFSQRGQRFPHPHPHRNVRPFDPRRG